MGADGQPWQALLIAVLAAGGFALSAALQHMAAPGGEHAALRSHRLLLHLVGRPWWLLGQLIAFVSFGLHAFALHLGTLALVQPVVVSGIVLAIPVRAALARRLPSARELGTVTMTVAGLGLFLLAANPTPGGLPDTLQPTFLVTSAGVLVAVLAVGCGNRARVGERAASCFGIASGVLFGLVAGLLKLTAGEASVLPHPLMVLGLWTTWAIVPLGLAGVMTTQRGYRAARISASMPVLNVTDVLVALLFGVAVLGEVPAHDPVAVLGEVVAAVLVVAGLRRLSSDDTFALIAPAAPSRTGAR